ncbi:MAG: hypothetical protein HXY28_05325 [Hydrogenophilaceae bacterium]|jgi:beta-lactamase regulating signal transducer with metallopeptidase domain|nr:hypothetical protein [Hydrogenophilaceae bacterium]
MTPELLALAARLNLVLAGAIFIVLFLRAPARAVFGARIAYALWALPAVAAAAALLPARVVEIALPIESLAAVSGSSPQATASAGPGAAGVSWLRLDWPTLLFATWSFGAAFALALIGFRQARYVRALGALEPFAAHGPGVYRAQSREAGPAVVGVIRPIIVTPADFEARYDAREQHAVIAHERAHLRRCDPLINAAVSLAQCAFWFNPLVHVGARALRIDQELACDETVIAANAAGRRVYAEAMLKAHPALPLGPLGCAWPNTDFHRLKERIAMLKRTSPSRVRLIVGASAAALAALTLGAVAWSAQPARLEFAAAHGPHVAAPDKADGEDVEDQADGEALEGGEADDDDAFEAQMDALDAETEALAEQLAALHARRAAAIRAHVAASIPSEAELEAIQREAMAAAEAAIAAHRVQIWAHAAAAAHTQEIQRATLAITERALALASAEMRGELTEEERERLEREIEAHAERIEAWAERFAAEIETAEDAADAPE